MAVSIEAYRLSIGMFQYNGPYKPKIISKNYSKRSVRFALFLFLLLIYSPATCNSSYDSCKQHCNNKNSHIYNGNIKGKSLKILHWNKGNSKFEKK